jgi:hypothetical protein
MRVIRGYMTDVERLETETGHILSDRTLWLDDIAWSKFWSIRGEINRSLFTTKSLAYRWGREDFVSVLGAFERYVSVGEFNSALSQLNALRQDASDEARTALVQKIRDEILPSLRERSQKAAMAVSPDNIKKLMSADAELGELIEGRDGARLAGEINRRSVLKASLLTVGAYLFPGADLFAQATAQPSPRLEKEVRLYLANLALLAEQKKDSLIADLSGEIKVMLSANFKILGSYEDSTRFKAFLDSTMKRLVIYERVWSKLTQELKEASLYRFILVVLPCCRVQSTEKVKASATLLTHLQWR